MGKLYSVYCDESCHLEQDNQKTMVLGSVWCDTQTKLEANKRIREIKARHGLSEDFEVKWTKISPGKIQLYLDLVDYFFDNDELHFRAVIIPDKGALNHAAYVQTHDDWYYKMYFTLLKAILLNTENYEIYIDIKDTQGGSKVESLKGVLSRQMYDFQQKIIKKIQLVHSHEVSILQITDLLIGAVMYENRGNYNSDAKKEIISRIQERSGYTLKKSTLLMEPKFNLFVWQGKNGDI